MVGDVGSRVHRWGRDRGGYLGEFATVMDAQKAKSWIDEQVIGALSGKRKLMWVKGHNGVAGNGRADSRAKEAAIRGKLMPEPSIAAPAGIRQV